MDENTRADAPTAIEVRPCQVEALKIERLEAEIAHLRAENSRLKDELIVLLRGRVAAAPIKVLWSEAEERRLIELWDGGMSVGHIASEIGRPYQSIRGKLERLRHLGKLTRMGSFTSDEYLSRMGKGGKKEGGHEA